MLARIDVGTPDAATELAAALNAAGCVAIADAASVAVTDIGLPPEEARTARIGLAFFLKAWAAERPHRSLPGLRLASGRGDAEEVVLVSEPDRVGAARDAELAVDVAEVELDGLLAHPQPICNLPVRQTLR